MVVMAVTNGQIGGGNQAEDSGFENDWSASETYHLFLYDAFLKRYFMLPLYLGAPCNFSRAPPSICNE